MERAFALNRLGAADAADYRALRLEGLRHSPASFSSSWEEESIRPLDDFADRLERNFIFGARATRTEILQGVAGFYVREQNKARHKGVLFGMYVRPEARGTGTGRALVARVIECATTMVEEITLTVGADNASAIRLYERAGFERYALERRALKVDGRYHDEAMMALKLGPPRPV
jgi:ribosomal protein S18 acetylase RimI-like enzyme